MLVPPQISSEEMVKCSWISIRVIFIHFHTKQLVNTLMPLQLQSHCAVYFLVVGKRVFLFATVPQT